MNPRLVILTGTLAGQVRALGPAHLSLGRDGRCDIRFDPDSDTDVSGRHAEVRLDDGVAFVRDTNSTNGVYVNNRRVRAEQSLADGDIVRLGAHGPKMRFESAGPLAPEQSTSTKRVAVAFNQQTRSLRIALAAAVVALSAMGVSVWASRRSDDVRTSELELLRRRNDSLSVAIDRDMRVMTGRVGGLDIALAAAKQETDSLRRQLATAGNGDGVTLLSERVTRAESRRGAIAAAARMDYEAIARSNGKAVVMIAVEMEDGTLYSGSGVCVSPQGAILTNRHLVRGTANGTPRRIAVIYADTRDWLPAHIDRVAADADLAVLRIERGGAFPFVSRVAEATPAVGAPVAIIGYPLGAAIPMDGGGDGIIARSTLGVGTVAKMIRGVLQIDAFALEGSSGSPVFSEDGAIAGIVYGGAHESAGRIVYAVPSDEIRALLRR